MTDKNQTHKPGYTYPEFIKRFFPNDKLFVPRKEKPPTSYERERWDKWRKHFEELRNRDKYGDDSD